MAAGVVSVVKAAQRGCFDFLQRLQSGPFFKEIGGQAASQILPDKLEGLWENGLAVGQKLIGQSGSKVHEAASLFAQEVQLAGLGGVWAPGFQMIGMFEN